MITNEANETNDGFLFGLLGFFLKKWTILAHSCSASERLGVADGRE